MKEVNQSKNKLSDITLSTVFSAIKGSFKQLVYPEGVTCSLCTKELDRDFCCDICNDCEKTISYITSPCNKCGSESLSGEICIRCKNFSMNFDKCISVSDYDTNAVKHLFKLKNGGKYISNELSYLMFKKLEQSKMQIDIILCVPLSKKSLYKRGYNQSELLAREISALSGVSFFDVLEKKEGRETQKQLTGPQRVQNLKGAFKIKKDIAFLKDKSVLIVDDVITTGTTLSECSDVIKKAGAKKVYCLTYAAVKNLIDFEL